MQISDRIGRRMKLHDLHVLMAVVKAGSMNKAAVLLNTTQPAISKSIAELERMIGVRLLDRHRQGIEPTEYGRTLLSGGATVFDELRQTVKNIEFLADPATGELRIGSNPLLAASFTAAVIDQLSQRYPRMRFELVTGYVDALYHRLSERTVDLLVTWRLGPIVDRRLDFEFLFDDSCVVVAGAQSPWAKRRTIDPAELVNEPWVLSPLGSGISSIALKALAAYRLDDPRLTIVTDSLPARMSLLATGRYLTIFPASAVRLPTPRPDLKVLPVKVPMAPVPNGIVTLKNRTLNPVARLFIDTAREVSKSLTKKK